MAALTSGLRVLIPLVLDSKRESDGGTLTPSLRRHATTFATTRPRKDSGFPARGLLARRFIICGFVGGSFSARCLFATFLFGLAVFVFLRKLHLISAALRLASVARFDTRNSPLLSTVTPFLSIHAATSGSACTIPAERCELVLCIEGPPHPPSTTTIHAHVAMPALRIGLLNREASVLRCVNNVVKTPSQSESCYLRCSQRTHSQSRRKIAPTTATTAARRARSCQAEPSRATEILLTTRPINRNVIISSRHPTTRRRKDTSLRIRITASPSY